MSGKKIACTLLAFLVISLALSACGGATQAPAPAATEQPQAAETSAPAAPTAAPAAQTVTLLVWDYYGEATPIKPLLDGFQKENPDITIKYEALDWDTTLEKLNVVLTGGTPPDVATVDMTWLPKFASLGAFTDLKSLSGGMLNGVPWEQSYTPGGLEAITFNNQIIAALYDFDTYALYYRADLFQKKNIAVPKTWDDLKKAAHQLAEGDKYLYEFDPDTFHGSQFIYENGGSLLNADNTKAAFNSPEAVEALKFYQSLVTEKVAIDWTSDQGERIQGVKDGRIAMFSDGPYYMGIMESGAPEMAGLWRVALHPYSKGPGSYLGGTGLVIPANSTHKDAAWRFVQYAMKVENQIGVYKYAKAAPAPTAALESAEVNGPNPFFGNQQTFSVFLETMKTAHHFPYVSQWNDIDTTFTTMMQNIGLAKTDVQKEADDAAKATDDLLSK